jgi:hypothetical protein
LYADLPPAKNEGIALQVNNENPNKIFVIVDRGEQNKTKYNEVLVVAQLQGELVQTAKLNLANDENAVSIAKANLPPGILQITVFAADGAPLAERITFISNYELPGNLLTPTTRNVQPRGKNEWQLNFAGYNLPEFSVAITDAAQTSAAGKDENILSSLLLSSDLHGYIHEPGHYFTDKSAATLLQLDLVMLTHGWRRFKWEKILKNDYGKLIYPVESSIPVRGIVKNFNGQPIANGKVTIITRGEDSTRIFTNATLNAAGEFVTNDIEFRKRAWVYYQGFDNKNPEAKTEIKLYPSFIDSLGKSRYLPQIDLDTISVLSNLNSPQLRNIVQQLQLRRDEDSIKLLQEVRVTAKKLSRLDSLTNEYVSDAFRNNTYSFEPGDYNFMTIWPVVQRNVPGIRVEGNPLSPNVYMARDVAGNTQFGSSNNTEGGDELNPGLLSRNGIAYFLNEVNVDKEVIDNLSLTDVALVTFARGEAVVMSGSMSTLSFYTKKGVGAGNDPRLKTMVGVQRLGYSVSREFYVPDYERQDKGKTQPDQRTTLYWNGNLRPDKDGKAKIVFFNNDVAKRLKIVVNGIDKDGKLVHVEQVVE